MIARLKQYLAARKLERIRREREAAPETQQYRRNRAAQRRKRLERELRVQARIDALHARWGQFERKREGQGA